MAAGMKSAWELAMEKTEKLAQKAREERKSLSPEQRAKISEVEKDYEARLAEKEVMMQEAIKESFRAFEPVEQVEALKERFTAEKQALMEERQKKIEAISKGQQG